MKNNTKEEKTGIPRRHNHLRATGDAKRNPPDRVGSQTKSKTGPPRVPAPGTTAPGKDVKRDVWLHSKGKKGQEGRSGPIKIDQTLLNEQLLGEKGKG